MEISIIVLKTTLSLFVSKRGGKALFESKIQVEVVSLLSCVICCYKFWSFPRYGYRLESVRVTFAQVCT